MLDAYPRSIDLDVTALSTMIDEAMDCARACASCGQECERHASMHEHRKVCAQARRRRQRVCESLLQRMR